MDQKKQLWVSIFIIAVMVAFFTESLFLFVLKTRYEKTQTQVKILTEVILDYYIQHNNTWPTSMEKAFQFNQLSVDNACAKWKGATQTGSCGSAAKFSFFPPAQGEHYAKLALQLPDYKAVQKIIRNIPMTYYDEDSHSLVFVLIAPLSAYNRTELMVKNIYEVDANGELGVQLTPPRCPLGWTPDYQAVQRWWFNPAGDAPWPQNGLGLKGVEVKKLGPWLPSIKTHNWDWTGKGTQGNLTVISYCKPPPMAARVYDPTFDYYRGRR